MTTPKTVAAVVVTYWTGPWLSRCLEALRSAPEVDEIVIVDNGNPAEVEAKLAALSGEEGKIKVLQGHGNVGFAAGCNLGARAATAQTLAFINPDCVVQAGAIKALCEAAETAIAHPAVVGGRVMNPDGREQRGCRRDAFTPLKAAISLSGLSRLERVIPALRDLHRERDPVPLSPIPVGAISGAFFLMLRSDFEALGGLDEEYFLHVEDLDLCRRASLAGGTVLFHPKAEAVHARSTSAAPRLTIERHKAAGFRRYFQKFARTWEEKLIARAVTPLIEGALIARARLSQRG